MLSLQTHWTQYPTTQHQLLYLLEILCWRSLKTKCCQLLWEINKVKCLEWYKAMLKAKKQFQNVVWSDECTVQLDHGRVWYHHKKNPESSSHDPSTLWRCTFQVPFLHVELHSLLSFRSYTYDNYTLLLNTWGRFTTVSAESFPRSQISAGSTAPSTNVYS